METSPGEKALGVLADERLDMTQPWALTAQRAKRVLGCIQSPVASRVREGILPLCSAVLRPHLQCCIQLWGPSTGGTWTCWSKFRGRPTKLIRGMEHLSYEERRGESGLFRLEKASGRPNCALPVPEGNLQERWGKTTYKGM